MQHDIYATHGSELPIRNDIIKIYIFICFIMHIYLYDKKYKKISKFLFIFEIYIYSENCFIFLNKNFSEQF